MTLPSLATCSLGMWRLKWARLRRSPKSVKADHGRLRNRDTESIKEGSIPEWRARERMDCWMLLGLLRSCRIQCRLSSLASLLPD